MLQLGKKTKKETRLIGKIGIITIFGNSNYGNKLQNAAGIYIAEKYGFRGETIINEPLYMRVFRWVYYRIGSQAKIKKYRKFEDFNKTHLHRRYLSKAIFDRKKSESGYDYVFVGGDQVWGWMMNDHGVEGYRFGSIVPSERRIPLSPSFGSDKLNQKQEREYYRKYLNEFSHLSVRESSGKDIIYDLIAKEAKVVIDPVMALTKEEWHKFFDANLYSQEEYILLCFLGGSNTERRKIVNEIAGGIKMIDVYGDNGNSMSIGPTEFLSLIYNAKIVCTDSFHCAAFSILFNIPFLTFDRLGWESGQNTRIENLLSTFKLNDRKYRDSLENCFLCDYGTANEILERERKEFYSFLDLFLNIDAGKQNHDTNRS